MKKTITICPLKQPGPVNPDRKQSFAGQKQVHEIQLEPGKTLIDTVAQQLTAANIYGGGILFHGLHLEPMHYVRPTYADTPEHVAFYSKTNVCDKGPDIQFASATYGIRDGMPFMHCHALWESEGVKKGGHLLASDCIVSKATAATVYSAPDIAMDSSADSETNFTLFHPVLRADVQHSASGEICVLATIRPNVDLITAIEELCREYKLSEAVIRSGIGSTVGAHFDDGRYVAEIPTELVILNGNVSMKREQDRQAVIDFALIDAKGAIHKGRLARGLNPVLICFEIILTGIPQEEV